MNCTPILRIRQENEQTNSADTEPTTMIVHPSSEQWDGKAGRHVCAWFITQIGKHWKIMSIALRCKILLAIPMSGNPTITSFGNIRPFVMQNMNGLVTRMAMEFEKFTPTPLKACGLMYETTCGLSKAFIKII